MPVKTSLVVAFVLALLGSLRGATSAEPLRVATWNVHEGFTPEKVQERTADLKAFATRVRPDVLVLEEVTSIAVAEAVRNAMGLGDYHVACSDFNPTDVSDFGGFEVAILSRFPITEAVEFDPTPDNTGKPGTPAEMPLAPLAKLGMKTPAGVGTIRGFLWARIDDVKLTVVAVHLKSSRGSDGDEDRPNAERREYVIAAVADSVAQDLRLFPQYTALVAGDFNVGHSDPKNGSDLAREDVRTTAATDGYDETHAILGGLLGLKMRNLTGAIRESTYPGIASTPIDNIYVAGAAADKFSPAALEKETFGSDHRPVVAQWNTVPQKGGPKPPSFAATASAAGTSTSKTSTTPLRAAGPPITPAEASKHLNGFATVEFVVQAANLQASTPPIGFLNSEADFRSDANFTAVVFDEALTKLKTAGVADFAKHFHGKRVRISGVVSERRGKLQVTVNDPQQIEIVK